MSTVKHDRQRPKGYYAPLIVLCIHTALVLATMSYITYEWMYTDAECSSAWWILLFVPDLPIGRVWLLAWFGLDFTPWSFSPYVEQVVIPALLFSVFGGAQWYFIVRLFTRKKVISGPKCHQCGYLLVGTTSDRCPECGEKIPPEMMTWVKASSVLSGCKDEAASPSDESSGPEKDQKRCQECSVEKLSA